MMTAVLSARERWPLDAGPGKVWGEAGAKIRTDLVIFAVRAGSFGVGFCTNLWDSFLRCQIRVRKLRRTSRGHLELTRLSVNGSDVRGSYGFRMRQGGEAWGLQGVFEQWDSSGLIIFQIEE